MSFFSLFFGKKKDPSLPDFVSELEALGYFRYADEPDVEKPATELTESFKKHRILDTEFDAKLPQYKDHRLYFYDGEDLFEDGGIQATFSSEKKDSKDGD
ncbi:hypothetical protein [Pollutibacter soli]|uniref:hypothetical protein n=1 Tax=Pollutibacter soli TaxID=3034157 RepID=UPI00301373CD